MPLYLDLTTGKTHACDSIKDLPGNAYYRGLCTNFLELNVFALEYAKHISSIQKAIDKNYGVKAINSIIHSSEDMLKFMTQDTYSNHFRTKLVHKPIDVGKFYITRERVLHE